MNPVEVQQVLHSLSLFHATAASITADAVRAALRGPVELGELSDSLPWPKAEAIVRAVPGFLDRDPARRLAWDLRDGDPAARIRLTKALIDAVDNQTLGPVDLLGPELRARPGLVDRLLRAADDIADILSDADFPPPQKQQLLTDLLATI